MNDFADLGDVRVRLRQTPARARYLSLHSPQTPRVRLRLAQQDIAFQEVAGRTRIYLRRVALPSWASRGDTTHRVLYVPTTTENAETGQLRLGLMEVIDHITGEMRNASGAAEFDFGAIRTHVEIRQRNCTARLTFADPVAARALLKEPTGSWSHGELPLKLLQTWNDGVLWLETLRAADSFDVAPHGKS
ncbi:MAG: hypothetical protein ACKVPX_14765 [Myxococcaceae bacterium]